jgi:hypothetical protein
MSEVTKLFKNMTDAEIKALRPIVNQISAYDIDEELERRKLSKQKYKIKSVYLLRLADKLVGEGVYKDVGPVPKTLFNMDTWIGDKLIEEKIPKKVKEWIAANVDSGVEACGTAACACGWATTDPFFRERGLGVRNIRSYSVDSPIFELTYNGKDGYDAAADFFHINEDHAQFLFGPDEYPDKVGVDKVAKRIRKFVADVEAGKITKASTYNDEKWEY